MPPQEILLTDPAAVDIPQTCIKTSQSLNLTRGISGEALFLVFFFLKHIQRVLIGHALEVLINEDRIV